jgi:hypothetical protein
VHHRAAVLPSELTAPNNNRLFDRADVKHCASKLPRRERYTLLLARISRPTTHRDDDRD